MEPREDTMQTSPVGDADSDTIVYPDTDPDLMPDNTRNARRMRELADAIRVELRRRRVDAWVATDLFVYPVEGEPRKNNAPDVLVAFGCPEGDRGSFRYWEEPGVVDFAGEFLSFARGEHLGTKQIDRRIDKYAQLLKTRELFIHASTRNGERLREFVFLRLDADGRYQRVAPETNGRYRSELLDMDLGPAADGELYVYDPASGERYLTQHELDLTRARADRAQARADRAQARADRAQARAERDRADASEARLADERTRADTLEEELRRYRERFGELEP